VDLELRSITDDEHTGWSKRIGAAFLDHNDDEEDMASWRSITELDRTIAVYDGGDIVGTAGAFSFQMAIPGGATLPAAGVTAVSVRSTHRRRGVLTRMMRHQLDDVESRGEPIAVLTASETIIYGRFGYGLGSQYWAWKLETDHAALASPSKATGRVRLIEKDEASKVIPGIRERVWRRNPGEVAWSPLLWARYFQDIKHERNGGSALWFAIHESDAGEADGYVTWRTTSGWDNGLPNGKIIIDHLYALDDEVESALWEQLASTDLVKTIVGWGRPVEDPLRWRLADHRRMQVTNVGDHLWVRILDVERSLSARELGADDRVVIEVVDGFRPQSGGRYSVAPSACTRTDADADLTLDIRDLGAIYLGGVTPTTLGRAGRIVEQTPGALVRADRLFASSATPWCATHF
jgi:predicted acetyltransferase